MKPKKPAKAKKQPKDDGKGKTSEVLGAIRQDKWLPPPAFYKY